GFYSTWTGRLLVPRAARDEFDDDPETYCDAVMSNMVKVDHEDYPSFLYEEGDFDCDAVDAGLCRGDLLLKAYRHVFTSASSVTRPPGQKSSGRGCISHIYKLENVAPESIAYIATLVRNVLSSSPTWDVKDGDFDCGIFFANTVALFRGGETEQDDVWTRDTLAWWNA
ncbi:hypothetical protein OH77DRAFT_1572506, partial [Trametes cingulata]